MTRFLSRPAHAARLMKARLVEMTRLHQTCSLGARREEQRGVGRGDANQE